MDMYQGKTQNPVKPLQKNYKHLSDNFHSAELL